MVSYQNLTGKSNVIAYEIGNDYIKVAFYRTSKTYQYSYSRAGVLNVERMKQLASNGYGLNSYINRYVRDLYDR